MNLAIVVQYKTDATGRLRISMFDLLYFLNQQSLQRILKHTLSGAKNPGMIQKAAWSFLEEIFKDLLIWKRFSAKFWVECAAYSFKMAQF